MHWSVFQFRNMRASKPTRKEREPRTSRPLRGVTRFPGSTVFAREHGVSHSHVFRVLTGERESTRLLIAFAEWLEARGMPWPAGAVQCPTVNT